METENIMLKGKKCQNCNFLQHSSHLRCLNCKHTQFSLIHPVGAATLISFTVLKAVPMEFREKKSYILGIVEFENHIRAMGQLSLEDDVVIGMKLKPKYTEICKNLDGKVIKSYIFEQFK